VDDFDRDCQWLVLPYPDDGPSSGSQSLVGSSVTFDIAPQLGCPVRLVDGWLAAVLGADMPEAPVDEHCDAAAREHQVWAHSKSLEQHRVVLAEPQTLAVERTAQGYLRLGVNPADRPHVAGAPLGGRHTPGIDDKPLTACCVRHAPSVARDPDGALAMRETSAWRLVSRSPTDRVALRRRVVSGLSVVEICAGAGGQSLGLHLAGFRHQLAVELDPSAARTLKTNLARLQPEDDPDEIVAVGDVADETVWSPEAHRGASLLAGGVPCPPFSIAGKQLGATDERDLFAWAVELAGRMQPDAVMLENVRGLSSPRFGGYRQAVIDRFDELGYVADWQLLEARDYGVPQLRPRFVLVALRPDTAPYFEWPEKKPTTETVGTTLFDLMAANGWTGAERWATERATGIAPTIVGGSKKHGGADLGPTRAKKAWAELGVDGLGIANEAPGRERDEWHSPKLTCQMVERLQGWNGAEYEWQFEGLKTSHYRQVGNAFPPPVARAVGESIARALRREGVPTATNPDRRMHDEVYRAMRDSGNWLTVAGIQRALGRSISADDVLARIDTLARDFEIEWSSRGGRPAWRLGEFKAFRGQDDHERHLAFAQRRSRNQIS